MEVYAQTKLEINPTLQTKWRELQLTWAFWVWKQRWWCMWNTKLSVSDVSNASRRQIQLWVFSWLFTSLVIRTFYFIPQKCSLYQNYTLIITLCFSSVLFLYFLAFVFFFHFNPTTIISAAMKQLLMKLNTSCRCLKPLEGFQCDTSVQEVSKFIDTNLTAIKNW